MRSWFCVTVLSNLTTVAWNTGSPGGMRLDGKVCHLAYAGLMLKSDLMLLQQYYCK